MSADLSHAIDLLRERLEGHAPQNDDHVSYACDHEGNSDLYREFRIVPPVDVPAPVGGRGDHTEATMQVEVNGVAGGDRFAALQRACDDCEDLQQRISYYNGQEWARASGFDFLVTHTRIEADGDRYTIRLTLTIAYNQRI